MTERALSTAFVKIAELAEIRGLPPMNSYEGVCLLLVDNHWVVRINGHREEVGGVPPFSALLEFNGWPAGLIDPSGGAIAAGSIANEDTFIAALEAAISDATPKPRRGPG